MRRAALVGADLSDFVLQTAPKNATFCRDGFSFSRTTRRRTTSGRHLPDRRFMLKWPAGADVGALACRDACDECFSPSSSVL